MRGFRLWGKKRGDRRTGSRLAASLGEAIFFGLLFLLGAILLIVLITVHAIDPQTKLYRVGFGFWVLILVLASFILIGGVGIFSTGLQASASAERRSALVKQAATIDLIREALPSARDYPAIPRDFLLTDSPGVKLAYRLPIVRSSTWQLVAVTLVCLALTSVATVLVVIAVQTAFTSPPSFFWLSFAVPSVAVSGWSIYHFLKRLWIVSRVGPTCVEVSDLPLRPGRTYEVVVSQAGQFSLQWLMMSLVCEEQATYQQGTDIRIETREAYRQPVFRREQMNVAPGVPLEIEEQVEIPPGAMHTLRSAHNAVRWKLEVSGQPTSWPAFTRTFPVIIYPNCDEGRHADSNGSHERVEANDGAADQSADPQR